MLQTVSGCSGLRFVQLRPRGHVFDDFGTKVGLGICAWVEYGSRLVTATPNLFV